MTQKIVAGLLFGVLLISATAQQRIGINTNSPVRTLDVAETGHVYTRVHSTTVNGPTGLELVRGQTNEAARDWRFLNDNGVLKVLQTEDNFLSYGSEFMRFDGAGKIGIGTTAPVSTLHLNGGNPVNGGNGYLILGSQSNNRMVFDNRGIVARFNNAPSSLYLQTYGGDTHFGSQGGRTSMALGGGYVAVGANNSSIALNMEDNEFQLYLRNDADDVNDWYIGASNNTWLSGDNQLLFSPTSSSNDAALRLMSVTENDGNNAPVMVYTSQDHTLLLDGNEIDTRGTPLYINHNSDQETYINPSGGRVGIGTSAPGAILHLQAPTGTRHLTLQNDNVRWHISTPSSGNGDLIFHRDEQWYAYIDGVSGQWNSLSDQRMKEKILPIGDILPKVSALQTYRYSFISDTTHTPNLGVLAQETELLFPEVVSQHEGQYGVTYAQLAVIALKAIQEQQHLLDTLREQLERLKSQDPSASTAQPALEPSTESSNR